MQEYNLKIFTDSAIQSLRLIREGDFWSLLLASLALLFVGQRLIATRFQLQKAASGVGLVGFLSVIAAEFFETGFADADSLPGLLFQALLGGGFSYSLATVVLPVIVLVWDCTLGVVVRGLRKSAQRLVDCVAGYRRKKRDLIESERQRERQAVIDARERARKQENARQQSIASEQQAWDDQRRQKARFECQLLFDQHHAELLDLFPDDLLNGYFEQYMNDEVPPELVEQRGLALQEVIRQRLKRSGATEARQFESISEVIACFRQQREEVCEAFAGSNDPNAQDVIETLNTQLRNQQNQAIREFLK